MCASRKLTQIVCLGSRPVANPKLSAFDLRLSNLASFSTIVNYSFKKLGVGQESSLKNNFVN